MADFKGKLKYILFTIVCLSLSLSAKALTFDQVYQGQSKGEVLGVSTASDSFTAADGTPLATHDSNWMSLPGYMTTGLEIKGNQVWPKDVWALGGGYYNSSNSDTSQILITASTYNGKYVCVRCDANTLGYSALFSNVSNGGWTRLTVRKDKNYLGYVGPSFWSQSSDHTVRITASGNSTVTLTIYVDGINVGSVTDSSSTIISGHPGFFGGGGGISQAFGIFDDWTDGDGTVVTPPLDTTSPIISNIQTSNIDTSSATISWTTDELSDSQLEYGLTTSYGSVSSLNSSLVTSHTTNLTGLSPSTLYHFRVKSKDASSNLSVSNDGTFTTSAASVSTPPITSVGTTVILNGGSYVLKPHPRVWLDGPNGFLTQSLSNHTSNGKANNNNQIYIWLKNIVDNYKSSYKNVNSDQSWAFTRVTSAALRWQADGDPGSLDIAKWGINHVEELLGGNIGCDESGRYCNGRGADVDYTRMYLPPIMQAYSIIHDQLTPAERKLFADKILNDNSISRNGLGGSSDNLSLNCVNQYPNATWSQTANNCGIIWLVKHHEASPDLYPNQASHYSADYPPTGGNYMSESNNNNLIYTALYGDIMTGLALADDDPRAVTLLEKSFDFYYTHHYAYDLSAWTGFTQSGAAYTGDRTARFAVELALALKNSIINGPDLTTGIYLKKHIPYHLYNSLPDTNWGLTFQDVYDGRWDMGFSQRGLYEAMTLYPDLSEAQVANYWLRNVRTDFNYLSSGLYLPWAYVFLDPALPSLNLNTAPTQYLFRDTDYSYCLSLGLNCIPNIAFSEAISRSGWGTNDSLVLLQSAYNLNGDDHSGNGDWGSVHIYRKGYLLSGDASKYNENRQKDNLIELGGGNNWASTGYASIPRWAGVNPTGESQNRYAYMMSDMTNAYTQGMGATRVNRHLIHFKKSGLQDYVVWYDDVATRSGNMKKALLHFTLNGLSSASAITFSGGVDGGLITNTQTNSKLLTSIFPVAGDKTVFVGQTGPSAYTYNAYVCAEDPLSPGSCSNSQPTGEWLVVNKPTLETGGIMPVISQPTCLASGGLCTALQIEDSSSPKVAVFSRQGFLMSSTDFTTTHAGTAQYLVVGLSSGIYNVTKEGSPVLTGVTVNDNDNTLYFESSSGSIVISKIGSATLSTPTISSFTASPTSITQGGSSNLSWSVSNATSLSIDQSVGTVTGLSSKAVSPTVTTTYTLTATNSSGSATRTVTLTVAAPIAPVISGLIGSQTTASTTNIVWTTDHPSDTQVEYGTSAAYGQSSVLKDISPMVSVHNVTLTGLTPATLYHFRVKSKDANNLSSVTQDFTFTTLSSSIAVVVVPPSTTPSSTPPSNASSSPAPGQPIQIPPIIPEPIVYIPVATSTPPSLAVDILSSSSLKLININGTYYLIVNSQRRGITNPGMLTSYGFRLSDAKPATAEDITLPEGEILLPSDGVLAKTKDDKTVYLVSNNQRHGFTSAKVFTSLGFKFSQVLVITAPELNKVPLGDNLNNPSEAHRPGLNINDKGTIYWIDTNNIRHPYPSLKAYNSWNVANDFSRVLPANAADLALPVGESVGERDVQ